jgi:hypothetical protein
MKKIVLTCLVGLFSIALAATASASLVFDLGGSDFTGSGAAVLPADALTLTFEQNGLDTVRLTIDAANMPTNTAKIKDVWFNVDNGLDFGDLSFSYVSGVSADSISAGGNVASAGIFDTHFEYDVSGALGAFYYGNSSVYDISGSGLLVSYFDDVSTKGYPAVFKLNETGNGRSGHYSTVPEPATMLLFGTGLAGLVGLRTRRKK